MSSKKEEKNRALDRRLYFLTFHFPRAALGNIVAEGRLSEVHTTRGCRVVWQPMASYHVGGEKKVPQVNGGVGKEKQRG